MLLQVKIVSERGILMIKYAVIGTGWIAEEFVKGTQLVDGLEFAAVYSRSKERGKAFAEPFGEVTIFDDINDLAKSDVDAVYIASPNSLHYSQSKLMLQNGKHVICEKPVTVEPEEFAELRALADEKNLIYMEAIMYMHLPARKILKEWAGKIGEITTAHFDFSQLSSKYPALKNGENPNIFNPEFATGCLMDLGIYCVYPALDLFGIPESISSAAGFLNTGADGYGTAVLDYKDKQVTLTYSKTGQSRFGSQIFGDKGTLATPSISKLVNLSYFDNDGHEFVITPDTEKHVLMSYEAQSFYNYITDPDTKVEYNKVNNITYVVNEILRIIRAQTGIKFR